MLTEKVVQTATAGGATRIIWDQRITGLGLRVAKGGTKAYVLQYRDREGRTRRVTLGRAAALTLRDARTKAIADHEALRQGSSGIRTPRRRATALRRRSDPTVAQALELFFSAYVPMRRQRGRISPSTESNYRLWAKRLDGLGHLPMRDVRREDVEASVAALRPVTANRVLSFASSFFSWAEREAYREQRSNPVYGIERHREEPRDRVLEQPELAALAKALRDLEPEHSAQVAAIRFAALTGLRIGEVLGIRWEHVDCHTGRLTIAERRTGRRTHWLAPDAVALLQARERPISAYAFAAVAGKPPAYKSVRRVFAQAAAAAGLEDCRLHDLRRSYMTAAAASGVNAHVLQDLLGHKTTAMANRYIRSLGQSAQEARAHVTAMTAAAMSA